MAQKQKKDTITPKASYFKARIDYLSNSIYNGRKDSMVLPYYSPSLGYYDKGGFYISGTVSYLSAVSESRIDLFALDLGYDFTVSDQFNGGIYGNKSFYSKSSSSVGSELIGSLGAYLSYDPGIITIGGGIDAAFSQLTDVGVNGSLSHGFYIGEQDGQWSISPTLTANAGTQNYYQEYYTNRKKSVRGRRPGNVNMILIKNANQFILLDYELSLPVNFDGKNWGFYCKPSYAIPLNPISVSLNGGTTYTTEKLGNSFYLELGAYIKF